MSLLLVQSGGNEHILHPCDNKRSASLLRNHCSLPSSMAVVNRVEKYIRNVFATTQN